MFGVFKFKGECLRGRYMEVLGALGVHVRCQSNIFRGVEFMISHLDMFQ